jgi:hypothetical protein
MFKHLYLLCMASLLLALSVALPGHAQTPVAYYPFNGNANDAIGTLHGTVNGATLTTDQFGQANRAYSFDGVDDFIATTGLATTNIDNWAMIAWINPIFKNSLVAIVTNGFDDNNSGNGYAIVLKDGANEVSGLLSGLEFLNSGLTLPTANVWYHLALVRRNGVTRVYVNGAVAAQTSSNSPITPSGTVRIGSQNGVRFFKGAIDEVKIYNQSLTDAQVLADYSSPTPVTLTGFTATTSGPTVRLDWATASEQNASHFEVERSLGLVDFETVGRVNAVGNSQTRQTYALTDETPLPGTSYYRLRQTDFDGKATTFKPVAVTMGEATGLLWANPSSGRSVRLRAPVSADIQLTTMQGRAIAFRKQAIDASTTELLPASVLPAGVYLVTVAGQSLKWVVE